MQNAKRAPAFSTDHAVSDSDARRVGRVLLVSRDSEATRQIGEVMRSHALSAEVSVGVAAACERLSHHKYEAVVIDLSLSPDAIDFLRQVRNNASNRTDVTFALADNKDDTALALRHGYNFVLERPLTAEAILHTVRVAYGLIVRERRRYFRYSITVPAVLARKAASEIYARTINVSEGGLALTTPTLLPIGSEATVEFTLLDPTLRIKAEGKVCWTNGQGATGLSFGFLPFDLASALQQWLSLKLEKELPGEVAERFRAPGAKR